MTLIELLACIFLIAIPMATGLIVAMSFGIWAGIAAGILAAAVCVIIVRFLWRILDRQNQRRRCKLREDYRRIFRVVSLPDDNKSICKPKGAEIQVGDYGWEAEPIRKSGLIYLQGLNENWFVVWWAGFRPDQVECVGPKPFSQYDWKDKLDLLKTPCPFPVQARNSEIAMGLPV